MPLRKKFTRELLFDLLVFLATTAIISLWYSQPFLIAGLLAVFWLLGLRFWHEPHDRLFLAFGAIAGTSSELVAVSTGAWTYATPTTFGIPLWLPLAWGLAVVLIQSFVEIFVSIRPR